jgi:hypothetical protein
MRHDMARCGCGALVRLPSMKASAYRAQCEACVGKSRAVLGAKPVEPRIIAVGTPAASSSAPYWFPPPRKDGATYAPPPPMPSGWVDAYRAAIDEQHEAEHRLRTERLDRDTFVRLINLVYRDPRLALGKPTAG